jgi:NNP family nitrate/nitrite transporter-like MFS transporter
MSFLYFDVSFMVWVLIGVLGVYIGSDFGLTAAQKGLMVALPILGGSLVRIPMGLLVERIGPKRTGILGQVVVLVPLGWAWLGADTLPQILALGLMLGVAGGSFAVALPLASRWYPPRHQGLAMGIAGAGNSGTVLTALFAPRLAESFGWHQVFGFALVPVVLTLALFILLVRETPFPPPARRLREYLEVCRRPDMLWFCLFYSFTFGGFVGLASFLVIFFHDQYGVSKVTAGTVTSLCVFGGSFMRPVGGYFADRFGGWRTLTLLFAAASIGLGCTALLPPLWIAASLLFVTMAALGMGNGSVFQLVPQRFCREIAVATGVVGAAGGLGGFVLPNLLGSVKSLVGSYGAGYLLLSLVGAGCFAALSSLRTRWAPALQEIPD